MNSNKTVTAHWERIPATTYTLRAIANPSGGRGGYVEISGGTSVTAGTKRFNQGARATVEARSSSGWRFVRWSGDLSGSSARQSLTMNGNKTVTALFQRATNQRTLTVHVVGNGRVNPSGSTSHDDGTIVALQAIPDRGYRLRGWSGSVSGTDPWITVRMNQDHAAIATFERATTARYELSVSVSGRGTVSGAGTYEAGRTVTLQATPVRGHRFVRWRGDATGSSISATIQMNEHKVVEALFERDDSTSLGSSDQIELRSEQPFSGVAIGDIITLRATVTRPNGGRVADATPVELTSQDQGVLMSLERTALSTRNGEVSARFVVVRLGRVVLLTQAAGDVLVSTVNVGGQSRFQVRVTASPANGGRVSGAGSYQSGRQIALRATPNEGFRFVRWEGGASGTRSSLTLRVTADATVRAVFERSSYTLTVQANPADGSAGRVEVEGGTLVRPGQKRFTSGERATLTAHTNTGWSFGGWSGDLRGSQSVQSIVIDADKTVTAQWVRSEQRAALFSSRSLPDRTWQVGQPVNSTLPAASGGSGRFTYSIRYEWNDNQTWTPTGVSFDRNSRRLSGVPRMQLDPNPALRRFTVFLRADDRGRTGQWDELQFVVNLRPAPTAQPTSSTTDLTPGKEWGLLTSLTGRIVARRLADGRIEFGFQPNGGDRILPSSRNFPANPPVNRWLRSGPVSIDGRQVGRVNARRLPDGRTEFGFTLESGFRVSPSSRYFPTGKGTTNWLRSSAFSVRLLSTTCRSLGPIADGIRFPSRNVKLAPASEIVYKVRGYHATGVSAGDGHYYDVCTQNQSISDDAFRQALFTAAMQRVYLESFVRRLPASGSWWDLTGWTDSSRFKGWLSENDRFIRARTELYPSEGITIADLFVSLIDTELVRLHSEVEDNLDRAKLLIGTITTISSLHGLGGKIGEYNQLAELASAGNLSQLGMAQTVLRMSQLNSEILITLAELVLHSTAQAVTIAKEDLQWLDDADRKDWMIEKMAEDVALVHSSASQLIGMRLSVSNRQPFTYEQAQDVAYHVLVIRSLGSPSGQTLMDLKHSNSWWQFIGGDILDVIPFVGSIVSIGANVWDRIDRDDPQRPATGYEPYDSWQVLTQLSARTAKEQHDEFLGRLGLPLRDEFRLPYVDPED